MSTIKSFKGNILSFCFFVLCSFSPLNIWSEEHEKSLKYPGEYLEMLEDMVALTEQIYQGHEDVAINAILESGFNTNVPKDVIIESLFSPASMITEHFGEPTITRDVLEGSRVILVPTVGSRDGEKVLRNNIFVLFRIPHGDYQATWLYVFSPSEHNQLPSLKGDRQFDLVSVYVGPHAQDVLARMMGVPTGEDSEKGQPNP